MQPMNASLEEIIAADWQGDADTRLRGVPLALVRVGWALLVLGTLGVFFAGLPTYLSDYQRVCPGADCAAGQLAPEQARIVPILAAPVGSYPTYMVIFQVAFALVWFAVGLVIFWRKSDDWMALLVSLMLILFGAADATHVLAEGQTPWQPLALALNLGAFGLAFVVFALFPNGRLTPRWAIVLIVLYAASALLGVFFPDTPLAMNTWSIPITGLAWFGLVFLLALAQAHRYWRFSSLVQRQQTKWIVLGVAAAVVGGGFWVPDLLFVSLRQPGSLYQALLLVVNFVPLLIPLTIGFSILRYQLWAIDTVINRVLVYSILTGLLALVYVACVFLLEYVLSGILTETSGVAILGSTIAIAALFQPLRRRVQDVIDRRFYRRKYQAGRLMAAFSASLRDEVDLQRLSEHLNAVVEQTMEPTYLALWLCAPDSAAQQPERSQQIAEEAEEMHAHG
ncbi:MAG TPA: hypothetical protein VFU69_03255 [Ktedonobacterales bacterium]|nr:hypothetical protein [Ktedonobacterales bacterium]